jgi:fibronectin type 3 domain-containing protein
LFSASAWAQSSACDLTRDGRVDAADVQSAINMSLGVSTCAANVYGTNVCNVVVVQRVINASLGASCLTGTSTTPHSVSLTWTASASGNVTGYKVYRSGTSGGPYSLITSVGTTTTATDNSVAAGQTYYYVVTAVGNGGAESTYSNQARAIIPTP